MLFRSIHRIPQSGGEWSSQFLIGCHDPVTHVAEMQTLLIEFQYWEGIVADGFRMGLIAGGDNVPVNWLAESRKGGGMVSLQPGMQVRCIGQQ